MFWTFMGKTEILTTQWKLIEREVTGNTVQIIGPDIWIDELRLHPKDAQMVTFTHEPLIGIISMTDQRNRTTYFDYDAWGRLGAVRDADKNVLEHVAYHYQIGL
jgi:YD repeat-containing protein